MTGPPPLVHSILARLKNEARRGGRPFAELLELFAVERFLHRLGRSAHRDAFVLKGALLLRHWLGTDTRPTRDIDLVGPPGLDAERLRDVLTDVVAVDVEADGIAFDPASMVVRPVRADSPVMGLRGTFEARMARTRLRYQVDVGVDDAIFPPPAELAAAGLLGFPVASVRAYTPYTAVAEKLEAMVQLGQANTRMKDYWDLAVLPRALPFDGITLAESVRQCFGRRGTLLRAGPLEGLSEAVARDSTKRTQWRAFLSRNRLTNESTAFDDVVTEIRRFVAPLLEAAHAGGAPGHWPAGGPWRAGGRGLAGGETHG